MSSFSAADVETRWLTHDEHQHLVPRQRILEQLVRWRHAPLRTLLAPMGAGKTTILRQYYQHQQETCVWLSLSEDDVSASHFLRRLQRAFARQFPGFSGAVLCHEFGDPRQPPYLMFDLLQQAVEQLAHPVTVIVDDLQFLDKASWRHSFLELLQRTGKLHWLVACTLRSTLSDALLRQPDNLLLTHEQLYFTETEQQQFLQRETQHPEFISRVRALTLGWPAGVKLAQTCAREMPDLLDQLELQRHELFATLVEKLLARLPEPARRLLIQTAFLERFNLDLCQRIVRGCDAARVIPGLLEGRFWLEWQLEHPLGYHCNPLVKQHLLAGFRQLPDQERERLVAGACGWLTERGFRLEGCLAASWHEDDAVKREYFTRNLMHWMHQGDFSDLHQRLLSPRYPELLTSTTVRLSRCWLLTICGHLLEAETEIARVLGEVTPEQALHDPRNEVQATCAVTLAIIRCHQSRMDAGLVDRLRQLTRHPRVYSVLRATLLWLLAEHELAQSRFGEAMNLARQSEALALELGHINMVAMARHTQIRLHVLTNDTPAALALCQDSTSLNSPMGRAMIAAAHCDLLMSLGRLSEAHAIAQTLVAESLPWLPAPCQSQVHRCLIRYQLQRGERDLAQGLLEHAEAVALTTGSRYCQSVALLEQFRLAVLDAAQERAQALAHSVDLEQRVRQALDSHCPWDWQTRLNWTLSGIFHLSLSQQDRAAASLCQQLYALNIERGTPAQLLPLALVLPWLEYRAGHLTTAFIRLNEVLAQTTPEDIHSGLFAELPDGSEFIALALTSARIQDRNHRQALLQAGFG